jgi:uncharacterized protein (DUF488 family)
MPWFNSTPLAASLAETGVEYRHFEALGGRRDGGLRGYADHMTGEEFGESLEGLLELACRRRTVVLCAEADWRHCHRRLLSDALARRGHEVVHVGPRGELEPHQPALEV